MTEKVLVVEDETVLQETLAYNLSREGYEVKTAGDGIAGLKLARDWQPDLVLLDVMLPLLDGFEVCKRIRAESDIPVLLLTARADEIDRVIGFEIGADDYVTKPFSMRELMARVKTRIRVYQRLHEQKTMAEELLEPGELIQGGLVIDRKRHEVRLDGRVLEMKPKEIELLTFLMENRGRAVSRETIMEKVWGWDYYGGSRTVDVHVRWLRSKIEDCLLYTSPSPRDRGRSRMPSSA